MPVRMKGGRLITIPPKTEKRIFLFLCCALALSVPFKPSYNSMITIGLLAFWLFFMEKRMEWGRVRLVLMISTLFWIALAGMLYTENTEEGWFRLQQKSLLLVFPLVFGTITISWQKELKWIVSFFLIGVLLACLLSLIDATIYWIRNDNAERFFAHGLAEFVNLYPYILALLCLMLIIILAEAGLGNLELHPWLQHRFVIVGLALFFSVFLLLLSVKQIIIAWLFFIVAYAIRLNKNRFVLYLLSVAFILTVLSVFFIPTLKTKVLEITSKEDNMIPLDRDASLGRNWNGIAIRRAIWACTMDVIKANPLLGVGTGDGQDHLQAAYENRQFYFASRYNRYNTHNQYLQTIVNFGIAGLLVWLCSLSGLLWQYRKNWLVFSLLACLLFAMLTESMFETNKGVLLMAYLFTVFCFHYQEPRHVS